MVYTQVTHKNLPFANLKNQESQLLRLKLRDSRRSNGGFVEATRSVFPFNFFASFDLAVDR